MTTMKQFSEPNPRSVLMDAGDPLPHRKGNGELLSHEEIRKDAIKEMAVLSLLMATGVMGMLTLAKLVGGTLSGAFSLVALMFGLWFALSLTNLCSWIFLGESFGGKRR